jgi:hypothetical protein
MHGRRLIALAAVTILSATAFAGCSWLGKGMEVSDAYKKTNEAKSGAYFASFEITAPKRGKQRRIEEFYTASGAFDVTDADHPRSHGEFTFDDETVSFVEPGNGRVYITEDRKTDYIKLPKNDRPEGKKNGEDLLGAVARAVVNFRDAPPVTNRVGQPIPAIAADISRAKLCGESLRAAARTINRSALNKDEVDFRITRSDMREGTRWCSKQMPAAPSLTFGIDNGLLTDFVLDGTVLIDRRKVTIQAKLQYLGLNQPQTGFIPPKVTKKSPGIMFRTAAAGASDRFQELLDSLPPLP